jgi:hypothetical protein
MLALGFAKTTRPSLLQIVGIDLSGSELHPLECLPHSVASTASDAASARMSLRWMTAELRSRKETGRAWPAMLLVVEDLDGLRANLDREASRRLDEIRAQGPSLGFHLLAGAQRGASPTRGAVEVRLDGGTTAGLLGARGERTSFVPARVGVGDLDRLLCGAGTARGLLWPVRTGYGGGPWPE